MRVLPPHLRRLQQLAIEGQAMIEHLHRLFAQRPFDSHKVLLLHRRVLADQLLRDASVLREDEKAGRVDVEASRGREVAQLLRCEVDRRAVVTPSRRWIDQHDRRLISGLRLRGYVADRLVEENRHAPLLLGLRPALDSDGLVGQDLRAKLADDFTVDTDPSARDPFVGLATRTEAELRHPLRQA